jgi:hypothetical protein
MVNFLYYRKTERSVFSFLKIDLLFFVEFDRQYIYYIGTIVATNNN